MVKNRSDGGRDGEIREGVRDLVERRHREDYKIRNICQEGND